MKHIGLMSDTHGYLHPGVFGYFSDVDEIWHAGDIGSVELAERLEAFKPLRAVWGNVDGAALRIRYPEYSRFSCEGVEVLLIHIAGTPGKYTAQLRGLLALKVPQVLICGHSHILKVMPDPGFSMLYMNPGACGRQGWHKQKTLLRFDADRGQLKNLEVIELPKDPGV